jgi:hypothetical protein
VGSKDGNGRVSAQSKTDRKNKASRDLFEYADQMKDSAAVLQHSLDALSNETTTQLEKNTVLSSLQDSIVPMLETVFKVIQKAVTGSSSMASVSTAHDRLARRKKIAVVDRCSKRPASIQLINHTVKKFKTNATTCDAQPVSPQLQLLAPAPLSPNPMELEPPEKLSK